VHLVVNPQGILVGGGWVRECIEKKQTPKEKGNPPQNSTKCQETTCWLAKDSKRK